MYSNIGFEAEADHSKYKVGFQAELGSKMKLTETVIKWNYLSVLYV